jgi:hypothetical protein
MKKMIISLLSVAVLGYGINASAADKVILTDKPVVLIKGTTGWEVPEGATYTYYSYNDNGKDFICTTTEPVQLKGVTGNTISIKMPSGMTSVRCYDRINFIAP